MLLAIDVGNTNIVLGAYEGTGASAKLLGDWRIRTDRERTADEHGMLVRNLLDFHGIIPSNIRNVAISSVVPTMNETLSDFTRHYFQTEPFFVSSNTVVGFEVKYRPASDVGADRLCNAAGAFEKYGGPCVVVDLGTATTFDAIASNGDYLGGAILPGIGISMDALFRQASRLFRVEFASPPQAIGTNTVHAMQSGLAFGFAGQVDAMVERFKKELGECRVIATGGLAELISKESSTIELVDQLVTLDGLRLLFERR